MVIQLFVSTSMMVVLRYIVTAVATYVYDKNNKENNSNSKSNDNNITGCYIRNTNVYTNVIVLTYWLL